jgi:hypothetical protein
VNRNISVCIKIVYDLDDRRFKVRFLAGVRDFFKYFPRRPDWPWGPPKHPFHYYWRLFTGRLKWPGREADQPPLSSAGKNVSSCTSDLHRSSWRRRKRSLSNLRKYSAIFLESVSKATNNLGQIVGVPVEIQIINFLRSVKLVRNGIIAARCAD